MEEKLTAAGFRATPAFYKERRLINAEKRKKRIEKSKEKPKDE